MNEHMMEQAELAAFEAGYRFNPETLEYEHESDGPFDDVNWKPERFVIDNDKKADWAIEKIKDVRAEFERLRFIALDRIAELNQRINDLQERTDRRTGNLEALLVEYFQTVKPTKVTKTQAQYELLSGKLVMKYQQPEYVLDDAQMVSWAKTSAPAYIKVKESINWAELKKQTVVKGETVVLADTGEVIPGAVAKERPDVFEVQA